MFRDVPCHQCAYVPKTAGHNVAHNCHYYCAETPKRLHVLAFLPIVWPRDQSQRFGSCRGILDAFGIVADDFVSERLLDIGIIETSETSTLWLETKHACC